MMKKSLALALALSMAVTGAALAATKSKKLEAPKTVGPFLAFCDKHFKECEDEIATDQIMISLTHNEGEELCPVPRGVARIAADHQILAWLVQHSEMANATTTDGVKAAMKGVWNCVREVPNGTTYNGAPENTGAFLDYCKAKANAAKCNSVIVTADLRAYAASVGIKNGENGHCFAPKTTTDAEIGTKVRTWLIDHTETHDQDIEDTATTAIDALWPCH